MLMHSENASGIPRSGKENSEADNKDIIRGWKNVQRSKRKRDEESDKK